MSTTELPDRGYIKATIDAALREDGAANDCTTDFLSLGRRPVTAHVVARDAGVIAGLEVARMVFLRMDGTISVQAKIRDGARVSNDDVVAVIEGPAAAILSAERVALNFLQHLSGVATLTARFVQALRGTGVKILDTRKTTPLLRPLERYAVRVGGGVNHRYNLSDMILIKENHVRSLGGVPALSKILSASRSDKKIEVEVDTIDFLRTLLGSPVDRIMLDNFSPREVRKAIEEIEAHRARDSSFDPEIEVSGGVDLGNVTEYAVDGLDYVSVGALTHSAPALDISLEVVLS